MNDLLFYAIFIALLYYFFIYLPQQKQIEPTKLTQTQSTQTDPHSSPDQKDCEKVLDSLIASIRKLNQEIK